MKRASLSATPKWRPSTSKATPSIPSGITPSSPVPAKHQVEALISRSLLCGHGSDVFVTDNDEGWRGDLLKRIVDALTLNNAIYCAPNRRAVRKHLLLPLRTLGGAIGVLQRGLSEHDWHHRIRNQAWPEKASEEVQCPVFRFRRKCFWVG